MPQIAPYVLTDNSAIAVRYKELVMLGTSVISVLKNGRTKIRYVPRVTIAQLAPSSRLGVLQPFTTLALVPEMYHSARHAKLVTTVLIMIVFRVFVPKVTSALRKPKSRFHVGKVLIIP